MASKSKPPLNLTGTGWEIAKKRKNVKKRSSSLSDEFDLGSEGSGCPRDKDPEYSASGFLYGQKIEAHSSSCSNLSSMKEYEHHGHLKSSYLKANSTVYAKPKPVTDAAGAAKDAALPCKFYLLGGCAAGKSCRFLHVKHSENPKLTCSYYLKGYCKFGDRCALEHTRVSGHVHKRQSSQPGAKSYGNGAGHAYPSSSEEEELVKGHSSIRRVSSLNGGRSDDADSDKSAIYHREALLSSKSTESPPLQDSPSALGRAFENLTLTPPLPGAQPSRPLAAPSLPGSPDMDRKTQKLWLEDTDAPLQTAPCSPSMPVYDKSLFEDHDNDLLNAAANEWMNEVGTPSATEDVFLLSIIPSALQDLLTVNERKELCAPAAAPASRLEHRHYNMPKESRFTFSHRTEEAKLETAAEVDGRGETDQFGLAEFFDHTELAHKHRYAQSASFPRSNNVNIAYSTSPGNMMYSASPENNAIYSSSPGNMMSYSTSPSMSGSFHSLPYIGAVKSIGSNGFHIAPPGVLSVPMDDSTSELCSFAKTDSCRYGLKCRYLHGDLCQYCQLYVLHPSNMMARNEHIEKCAVQNGIQQDEQRPLSEQDLIECGICYERVMAKPDTRFGLLNCDHAFCLECIRSWRANQSLDPSVVRSCPICRTLTHVITPSVIWTRDQTQKAAIIEEYKSKLKSIPCKYFKQGDSACPFGGSCLYAHFGKDGKPIEPGRLRTCIGNDEEVKIVQDIRLSDFLTSSVI